MTMVKSNSARSVSLENVGPIQRLTVPIPPEGGVVVLRGRNGAGKSHGIAAVSGLYSGSTRKNLRARDGSLTGGRVTGLGVTVKLGRSNRATGELECEALDGDCDPSLLVDPGIKDPAAADAKRLATLVRLAGVQVSAEQWGELFSGAEDYRDLIDLDALQGDDPVITADRIRRRLHDIARDREKAAETAEHEADAMLRTIEAVDVKAEHDESTLRQACDLAAEALVIAKQRRKSADEAAQVIATAKADLAKYESQAMSISDWERKAAKAEAELAKSALELDAIRKEAAEIQRRFEVASTDNSRLRTIATAAQEQLSQAQRQKEYLDRLRNTIDTGSPKDAPTDAELAELERIKINAQNALSAGKRIADVLARRRTAEQQKADAAGLAGRAARIREIARSTDTVLEQALYAAGFTAIRVHNGTLCVETDRGMEPFSELSHGERWRLALDLAARGVAPGRGLLPVCQEGWECLDPDNRRHVHELARDRGLVILTAEATDGELRAETFDGEAA